MNSSRKIRLFIALIFISGFGMAPLSGMKQVLTTFQIYNFVPQIKATEVTPALYDFVNIKDNIDDFFSLISEQLVVSGWDKCLESEVNQLFEDCQQEGLSSMLSGLNRNLIKSNKQLELTGWSDELKNVFSKLFGNNMSFVLFFKSLSERFDNCSWEAAAIFYAIVRQSMFENDLVSKLKQNCCNYIISKKAELDVRYDEQASTCKMTLPYAFLFLLGKILEI